MRKKWPTPAELADYLKGKRKAKGMMAIGSGRCCLGHYADMCGLEYPPEQAHFVIEGEYPNYRHATLPPGHWLLQAAPEEIRALAPELRLHRPMIVQEVLATENDHSLGFARVQKILRSL
jgi:hypothetical protein